MNTNNGMNGGGGNTMKTNYSDQNNYPLSSRRLTMMGKTLVTPFTIITYLFAIVLSIYV